MTRSCPLLRCNGSEEKLLSSAAKYIIANATGIPTLLNWLNRKRLLVVTYHGIYDDPRLAGMLPDTFVHVEAMARQLREIKKHYRLISPDDLLQAIDGGTRLPLHAALVTFDDGYESFFRLAEPVLRSLGIRAIVFVPTRAVEERQPFWFDLVWYSVRQADRENLSWLEGRLGLQRAPAGQCLAALKRMPPEERSEIVQEIKTRVSAVQQAEQDVISMFYPLTVEQMRELVARGTTFGGHTHTHTILSSMADHVAEADIKENKTRLERIVKRPVDFFAYPNGGIEDFAAQHKAILRRSGYKAAFSLTQARTLVNRDVMEISRINVAPEDSTRSLLFRCTGVTPAIKYVKKFLL